MKKPIDTLMVQRTIVALVDTCPEFSVETMTYITDLIYDAHKQNVELSIDDYVMFGKVRELEILARPNETVH